ncbi:MAG: right-handed parallel beta-helix repeat-containing protein [Acidimicrobiia bacterium]|nr:right-handed parallel beta-helix repeat-containing protein [Acidimicrobiia bacterium]
MPIRGVGPRRARALLVVASLGALVAVGCSTDETGLPTGPAPQTTAPAAGAGELGRAEYPVPGGARVVSPSGDNAAAGTLQAPWRTLAHAVAQSPARSTVVLREGTYRESVQVYRKALTIQPYPGERVVLSGSDVVGGWTPDAGDFVRRGWTPSFPRTPDAASSAVTPQAPLAGFPELAFVDGVPQRQVGSRAEVVPGTFFVDDGADAVYLGVDPAGRRVELSARAWGLYLTGAHDSVVGGIGVRHFATPSSDIAALRAYADRVQLERLVVEDNAQSGISVIGTDTQVRSSTLYRNGQLGIHGLHADGLRVTQNVINGNNAERFDMGYQSGGLKVVKSRRLRFDGNIVRDNIGHGLWVDQSSYDVVMSNNTAQRNAAAGLHLEVSARGVLAGNVSTDNGETGILIVESHGVDVWNNTALYNRWRDLDILDNDRTSSNLAAAEHDRRWPLPNPEITWDVRDISVRNNVIGGGARNLPVFRVDDVTHVRSYADMGVTSDYNAFYRRDPSVGWLTLFSQEQGVLVAETLGEHRQVNRQDQNSATVDGPVNPWVTDARAGDFRVPPGAPNRLGAALPARVAEALRRSAGERMPIGPLQAPR